MIHFERSFDYETIRAVMTHPLLYRHLSDDGSPPADQYKPIEDDRIWYIEAERIDSDDFELLGYWIFHPQNAVCWEVHTVLLPSAWGPTGQLAACLLPAWIWANTPCRRIVTNVPTTNRLALHFALKAGMRMYGVNEASYLKNGVLYDQICLGITAPQERPMPEEETGLESRGEGREEESCQPQQQSSRP